jgi:preprotein translocase subunit SecE
MKNIRVDGSTMQTANLKMTSETPERTERPERERPQWIEDLLAYPRRASRYLQDVRSEMKLVVWPSPAEVRSTTLVVIMTTILFAVFLWLVDKGSERVVHMILKANGH